MSTERFTTEGNIVFCDGAKIAKAYRLGDDSTRWSEANATRIAAALNAAEDDGCSEEFWSWLFDNCEVTWQPKTVGNGTVISSQCVNDKSEQQQIRNKWAT